MNHLIINELKKDSNIILGQIRYEFSRCPQEIGYLSRHLGMSRKHIMKIAHFFDHEYIIYYHIPAGLETKDRYCFVTCAPPDYDTEALKKWNEIIMKRIYNV
jgi:hypothetical protein